jgi:hypothetical protein
MSSYSDLLGPCFQSCLDQVAGFLNILNAPEKMYLKESPSSNSFKIFDFLTLKK